MVERMDLHLLGVSFRCAAAEVRRHMSFSRDDAGAFLKGFAADLQRLAPHSGEEKLNEPRAELCLLSTCNRTELYLAARDRGQAADLLHSRLKRLRPLASCLDDECKRYQLDGAAALAHLFHVVCGLDSLILGDVQIVGQVREALNLARGAGTSGRYLERAIGQALSLGAQARRETAISAGSAGVAAAVADMFLGRCTGGGKGESPHLCEAPGEPRGTCVPTGRQMGTVPFSAPGVLLIGGGEIVDSVGRILCKRQFGKLTFVNRTLGRAEHLARQCGGDALSWQQLIDGLATAELVLAATAAAEPVLTTELLARAATRLPTGSRPLIIDVGMPPNVERASITDSGKGHGRFEVVGIDAVRERQDGALTRRRAAIPFVENLIEKELDAWKQWQHLRPTENLIKTLYLEADEFAGRLIDRLASERVTDARFEYHVRRSLKQFLHGHVGRLRGLANPVRTQR
jgi:glutamyl-tRNA reductase